MSDRLFLRLLMRLKGRSNEEGFTLLEVIVALVLLGILVAVALPTLLSLQAEGRRQEAVIRVSDIAQTQLSYYSGLDGGTFASTFQELQDLEIGETSALSESPSYIYTMSLSGTGTDQSVTINAVPKNDRSFPIAAARVFTQGNAPYFVVCSADAGATIDMTSVVVSSQCP